VEKSGRPEYKDLKKRMREDFRQIRKAVRKGKVLDMNMVHNFCSNARLMTTHEKEDNEHYVKFIEHVEELAAAAKGDDRSSLLDVVEAIRSRKKECHRRYKK
jgi:XXXCH domain-containing protein